MLFDLQSPGRRRVIKVIYAFLAVLLAVGLVGFGIGSDATGGLSEVFGGDSTDPQEQFQEDIDDAEEDLAADPKDAEAYEELIRLHFSAGTNLIEVDEAGQQVLTPDAEDELQRAADVWDRYRKQTKGQKVDNSAALIAVQVFSTLGNGLLTKAATGSGQEALSDADDAVANWKQAGIAQEAVAGANGNADQLAQAAGFYYLGNDPKQGDRVAALAVAAAKGNQATQIRKQLDTAKQEGERLNQEIESFRKQIQAASQPPGGAGAGAPPTGGEDIAPDFGGPGGLGGGGGLITP